jgi:hypothetical protein
MIDTFILKKMHIKIDTPCFIQLKHLEIEKNLINVDIKHAKAVLYEVETLQDLDILADMLQPNIDQSIWIIFKKPNQAGSIIRRDHPLTPLAKKGYETVGFISINEVYSAIRLRHLTYIKTLTRLDSNAITKGIS